MPGEPKARFPRTAGTVTSLVTASSHGDSNDQVADRIPDHRVLALGSPYEAGHVFFGMGLLAERTAAGKRPLTYIDEIGNQSWSSRVVWQSSRSSFVVSSMEPPWL